MLNHIFGGFTVKDIVPTVMFLEGLSRFSPQNYQQKLSLTV